MQIFSQVSFLELEQVYQVEVKAQAFVPAVSAVQPPTWLTAYLAVNATSAAQTRSEKAISEDLIAPILRAVQVAHAAEVGLFSGEPLSDGELSGVCDFVLTGSPDAYLLKAPLLVVVEAKKQELSSGIAQCVAEMIAARRLNERAGLAFTAMYGCVTTGNQWQFLRLRDHLALADPRVFYLSELGLVLGAFEWIIGQFNLQPAA